MAVREERFEPRDEFRGEAHCLEECYESVVIYVIKETEDVKQEGGANQSAGVKPASTVEAAFLPPNWVVGTSS